MKSSITSLLLMLVAVTCGCSTVTVKQPLGEKLSAAELKSLEGVWLHPDGHAIEVHALSNGRLTFGIASWDDKEQQFKLETGRFVITRAGSLTFAALPSDSGDRYTIALCKLRDHDTFSFYLPAVDVFEKGVADHDLEGTIEQRKHDKTVNIDTPSEKVLDFITRTGVEKCFVDTTEDGVVYKRASRR